MAKLMYSPHDGIFSLKENDRDEALNDPGSLFNSGRFCCFFLPERNIDQENRLLSLFGVSKVEGRKKDGSGFDKYIISENTNPYVMKINWRCVVYFGEDMPVVKSKTVRTKTKHYQLWTGNTIYKKPEPETYFYVEVKEKDKLFFFYSCHYDFSRGERLVEFNEKKDCIYCYNRENFDYIAKLDYPDDLFKKKLSEKIEKEEKEREETRKRAEEKQLKMQTDGFCDLCGEPAEFVADPFQHEYGRVIMRWLCTDCYNNILGDI